MSGPETPKQPYQHLPEYKPMPDKNGNSTLGERLAASKAKAAEADAAAEAAEPVEAPPAKTKKTTTKADKD